MCASITLRPPSLLLAGSRINICFYQIPQMKQRCTNSLFGPAFVQACGNSQTS